MKKVKLQEKTNASKSKINTEDNLPPLGVGGLDIQLRSEEVQEILTKVPHWMIRWGNALFLGLIIMILFIPFFLVRIGYKGPYIVAHIYYIIHHIPENYLYLV